MLQLISKRFRFALRKTSLKKELIGGMVTFFAMVYILPVNANILSDKNNLLPYGGVFMATAIIAGLSSILIGMFSNLPIAIAPGMGANLFFVNTIIKQFNIPWEQALSIVIINGFIFLILAASGVIEKFMVSLPKSFKNSFVFALGLYLAYIGLKAANIVVIKNGSLNMGSFQNIGVLLSIIGMLLIFILYVKKVKMAILITLLCMSGLGIILGQIIGPSAKNGLSSFESFNWNYNNLGQINTIFGKGITHLPVAITNVKTYPSILALTFMMISGVSGTIVSTGELANLEDKNGNIEGSKKAMIAIGISSTSAGVLGSSPTAGFLESNAGIISGARTGVSSICVGLLFLLAIPLYPILEPLFSHSFVTSPVLILVGLMMARKGKDIEWKNTINLISSFILITIMLFTSSILNGMAFGIVFYVVLNVIARKEKEINIYMYIFFILFLAYLISMPFIT